MLVNYADPKDAARSLTSTWSKFDKCFGMNRLWQFVKNRENREIISWVATGCAALTAAAWAVFVYLHNPEEIRELEIVGLKEISEQCITHPIHPNAPAIVRRIAKELERVDYIFGWRGGVANVDDTARSSSATISDIVATSGTLTMHYDWQHGQLRLVPVLPEYGSVEIGAYLAGGWLQDQGHGCIEMSFDSVGQKAEGWWANAKTPSEKATAFITTNRPNSDELLSKAQSQLRPLYFAFDSADLLPESIERLKRYSEVIKEVAPVHVIVEGHSAEVNPAANIPLSSNRAIAVQHALISLGIDPATITVQSFGAERPLEGKEPDSGYNARVEIRLGR